uniref:Uncharacterized protein n=1 Tax=Ditylenchus dipsaci TaxID=166011 RepID=A0A915DHE3_9BILA
MSLTHYVMSFRCSSTTILLVLCIALWVSVQQWLGDKRFDVVDKRFDIEVGKRVSSEELVESPYSRRLQNGGFRMGFGKRSDSDMDGQAEPFKLHQFKHMGFGKRAYSSGSNEEFSNSPRLFGGRGYQRFNLGLGR